MVESLTAGDDSGAEGGGFFVREGGRDLETVVALGDAVFTESALRR